MKKILQLIGLLSLSIIPIFGQEDRIPEDIVLSFRAGNAEELSNFLQDNVELIILDTEDVYSRTQAEQILRKFFLENRPTTFNIIFEGGKETSRYAIGSLVTQGTNFRVYVLIKNQDGKPLIHQLRIELEDEEDQ